ncbi:alpha/beta hydrolase [Jidongwangia harbinensis]|uniref:alpha/beta hydrolase n=1 Tax=Jidongwangia harbinensis TaxID=2878561 RepID=UPI001CD9449D|nr:alpha/beta hydrolase [Jidongwangia harbinensis]MCA2215976.1 alpha/beta hydrolase [Jidongwangia harbinensis]
MRASVRFLAGSLSGLVLAGLTAVPIVALAAAAPAPTAAAADRTRADEARRVDRVPTPKLGWYRCYDYAECTTARLPLDYDQPNGPHTEIALLRVKARDQANKAGSLFLNPGGPGGPGTAIALAAPFFLSPDVVRTFDLVGFDPRGVAASDQVSCFRNTREQTEKLAGMNVFFPYGAAEEKAYVAAARTLGRACSTTGRPLSGAMSTAQAARDMDVLRRAVGDPKLTFLGFSYGTALGQYYANMFPDRFRAIAIDGVLNPVSWTGTKRPNVTLDDRLRSADGAYRALTEMFRRCDAAGTRLCPLAGRFAAGFALVAERLRAAPAELEDAAGVYYFRYSDFIGYTLSILYGADVADFLVLVLQDLLTLTDPETPPAGRDAARERLADRLAEHGERPGRDFPYYNHAEANAGVVCTDGAHPANAADWITLTAKADRRAPYFGRAWGWSDAMCARNTWTVRDEDAYRGPFTRNTAAPVLVVGNYWDPATSYRDAVSTAALLPNSRLLSSDSWGHTAYGTSACVTGAVDRYLLTGALPANGTLCVGDAQPFRPRPQEPRRATTIRTERAPAELSEVAELGRPSDGEPRLLPPVRPPR